MLPPELLEAIQEVTYRAFKGIRKVKRPDYFSIAGLPFKNERTSQIECKMIRKGHRYVNVSLFCFFCISNKCPKSVHIPPQKPLTTMAHFLHHYKVIHKLEVE